MLNIVNELRKKKTLLNNKIYNIIYTHTLIFFIKNRCKCRQVRLMRVKINDANNSLYLYIVIKFYNSDHFDYFIIFDHFINYMCI